MSYVEPTSPAQSLHARYRAALKGQAAAAARFDKLDDQCMERIRGGISADEARPAGFTEADADYDAAFNELEDLRDEYWAAPARSRLDWVRRLVR